MELGATVGWADADWRAFNCGVPSSGWTHADLRAIVSVPMGKHVTLRPFVHASSVLDGDVRAVVDRSDAFVAGIGFDYSW